MKLPVEIRDRSEYQRRMNELLRIDLRRTVVLTVDMSRSIAWVMTVDEFKAKVQAARVMEPAAAH